MTTSEIIRLRQLRGLKMYGKSVTEWKEMGQAQLDSLFEKAEALWVQGRELTTEEIEELKLAKDAYISLTPPTDLEHLTMYKRLRDLLGLAVDSAKELGLWSGSEPVIASELAGEINGFCFADENGERAIVIDGTLIDFIYLLAKVAAPMMVQTVGESTSINLSPEKLVARITGEDALFNRFRDLFVSYVESGTPSSAAPYWLDSKLYQKIADELTFGMELFVIAHECGHLALGHLEDKWMATGSDRASLLQKTEDGQTSVFIHRYIQEIQADSFAVDIVLSALDAESELPPFRILGPTLLLLGLETLERVLFYFSQGHPLYVQIKEKMARMLTALDLPSTHPPPEYRRYFTRKSLSESPASWQIEKFAFDFEDGANIAFWEAEKRLVAETRSEQVGVHQKWRSQQQFLRDLEKFIERNGPMIGAYRERDERRQQQ